MATEDPDMKAKTSEATTTKSDKQLSARELSAIRKFMAQDCTPRLKVENQTVKIDRADGSLGKLVLMEALGTVDQDFFRGLLEQLTAAARRGSEINEAQLNFMLSVIKGIQPRDQLEAMLAAQMAAVHVGFMSLAQQLANAESVPYQDSAERALNKLARTFSTQVEALKRHRAGVEQNVTVQHVSVESGGQAVVGNVAPALAPATPATPANFAALPPVGKSKLPKLRIVGKSEPGAAPLGLGSIK
jgi:hypothetical protein